MKIIRCDQRSAEWKKARFGRVTASKADQIISPEGKPSRSARKYLAGLVYERLVGESADRDISHYAAVKNGIEREPDARREFQVLTGLQVEEIGMVLSEDEKVSCSPDAVVLGCNEAVEIKCPEPRTQVLYLLDPEAFLETYRPQLQMQLYVGRWDLIHFYAYHPNTPSFYTTVLPDPEYRAKLIKLLAEFVRDLDMATEAARRMGPWFPIEALRQAALEEPEERREGLLL